MCALFRGVQAHPEAKQAPLTQNGLGTIGD